MDEELIARAEEVAKALGSPFMFGVRHAGSVRLFGHCGGYEADGSTFEECLEGVAIVAARKAQSDRATARGELEQAEKILALRDRNH